MSSKSDTLTHAKTLFANREYSKALPILENLQNEGCKEAAYCLGLMYLWGDGVNRDIERAEQLLEQAKEGEELSDGIDFILSLESDCKDLRERATNGDIEAMVSLAFEYWEYTSRTESESDKWMLRAAEAGDHQAISNMISRYLDMEDYASALPWLISTIDDSDSQYNLGRLYLYGFGVEKDINKALDYLKQAASSEYEFSHVLLARIYLSEIYLSDEYDLFDQNLAFVHLQPNTGKLRDNLHHKSGDGLDHILLRLARALWRKNKDNRDYARALICLDRIISEEGRHEFHIMFTYYLETELTTHLKLLHAFNVRDGVEGLYRDGLQILANASYLKAENLNKATQAFRKAGQKGSLDGQRWFEYMTKLLTPREIRQVKESIPVPDRKGTGSIFSPDERKRLIDLVDNSSWTMDIWPMIKETPRTL